MSVSVRTFTEIQISMCFRLENLTPLLALLRNDSHLTPSRSKIKTILAIKIKFLLCERPLEAVNSDYFCGLLFITYSITAFNFFSCSSVTFTTLKKSIKK